MKTNEMKRIMIALDYDPTAKRVAEIGNLLAKTMGAEVILLHVILDPVYYSNTGCNPLTVTFVGTSTNAQQYIWDFGDGTIINGADSIVHTYIGQGLFNPILSL